MNGKLPMRESMIQRELNEPVKWSFTIQTWETMVFKSAFPDKERHELLRLECQKLPLKARCEKLLQFLERPIGLRESLFENIGWAEIKETAQVSCLVTNEIISEP